MTSESVDTANTTIIDKRPSLKINALSNWFALGVNIVTGFFLTPFIVHHLGKDGYGIWTLIGSFIGYYGLLNLGVGSAITRYVARYAAQGDKKALNETASTAMMMFCCTGVLAILVSLVIAQPLAVFFKVAPEHVSDFKRVVWILGLATGLSFPDGVMTAIIVAHEKFVLSNIVSITGSIVRAVLTVGLLLYGQGLTGVAWATLTSTVLSFCLDLFLLRRKLPWVSMCPSFAHWSVLGTMLIYGGSTTIIAIADLMRFNLSSAVIGKLVGLPEVGVYGIAALIIQYMLKVITSGMGVLSPRFAALDGTKEREKLQALLLRSLYISSLISFGIATLGILLGGSFIRLWVGDSFSSAIPVLWILAVSYAFALAQTPDIGLMYALSKHHFYAVVTVSEAIVNVILSILLAPKFGIIGVALGTAIPMFIVKLLIQPIYVSKIIKYPVQKLYKPILIPAMIASILIFIVCNSNTLFFMMKPTLFSLIVGGVIISILYGGVSMGLLRLINVSKGL